MHDSGECFGCHVKGVSFNWVGGGSYGREAFHSKTIAEAHREQIDGAKAHGLEIEKLPERAELI